jgi:hypothetical protein
MGLGPVGSLAMGEPKQSFMKEWIEQLAHATSDHA